jgi:hypothetical protein
VIPPLKKSTYIYSDAVSVNGVKIGRPRGRKDARPQVTRRKAPKAAKKPARKPGHPKAGEQPIPPAISKEVASMWLAGHTTTAIADKFGVHLSAMDRHIKRHLIPLFRTAVADEAVRVVGHVKLASQLSWERILADKDDRNAITLFMWAADNLMAITDVRSPTRFEIGYRVAGKDKEALAGEMVNRLADRMQELRSMESITVEALPTERVAEPEIQSR